MATRSRRPGTPEVPADLAAIAYGYGNRLANVIVLWLDSQGKPVEESGEPAPLHYLLELGSVLQLALWHSAGIADHLPTELPSLNKAKDNLKKRAARGPEEFEGPQSAPLFAKVFLVWWEHFAWHAPDLLDAEVLLGQFSEDTLVQEFAQFFWDSRHTADICNEE